MTIFNFCGRGVTELWSSLTNDSLDCSNTWNINSLFLCTDAALSAEWFQSFLISWSILFFTPLDERVCKHFGCTVCIDIVCYYLTIISCTCWTLELIHSPICSSFSNVLPIFTVKILQFFYQWTFNSQFCLEI